MNMTAEERKDLMPCPFCGNSDLFIHETPSSDKTVMWYKLLHTATANCGVSMLDSNKSELIKRWNSRPHARQMAVEFCLEQYHEDDKVSREEAERWYDTFTQSKGKEDAE